MLLRICDVACSASARLIGLPRRTAENIHAKTAALSVIAGEITEASVCAAFAAPSICTSLTTISLGREITAAGSIAYDCAITERTECRSEHSCCGVQMNLFKTQ